MKKNTVFRFRCESDLKQRFEAIARAERRDFADHARLVFSDYIDSKEAELGAQTGPAANPAPPTPSKQTAPPTTPSARHMSEDQEVPVKLADCRKAFGRGRTWMSAIKHALGVKGNFILISEVKRFIRDHPGWTEANVYQRKRKP